MIQCGLVICYRTNLYFYISRISFWKIWISSLSLISLFLASYYVNRYSLSFFLTIWALKKYLGIYWAQPVLFSFASKWYSIITFKTVTDILPVGLGLRIEWENPFNWQGFPELMACQSSVSEWCVQYFSDKKYCRLFPNFLYVNNFCIIFEV